MSGAQSPDEWLELSQHHRQAAAALAGNKALANQELFHIGLSVECALKAYIMHSQRMNSWPTKEERPDLWEHSTKKLALAAALPLTAVPALKPRLLTMFQWYRGSAYDPLPITEKALQGYRDAAFGAGYGLVTWISAKLTKNP
ncbi:hypothetical protein [Xanthobacter aminoxidans]|uniref:hypothetical protein n=1 Tax=Xanthobacter aminoxidans TaxID=186280 RepID=UPI00372754C2